MTNDTHNYSGVWKAFCTIIRSTEWKDSEITVPPRGISFWLVLTGYVGSLREQV